MPSSAARRRMRVGRRDGERSRNLAQRIQNNRELVETTGDPYDDTLKLTMSFVNKLSISTFRSSTRPDNKKKDAEIRTRIGDGTEAGPTIMNFPSTSREDSKIDAIKKSPEANPHKNCRDGSEVQIMGRKGEEVPKKSGGKIRNRFVKLMTLARGKENGSNHSCKKRDCGRCNLINEDYLNNR